MIDIALSARTGSDYNDFYLISKDEVKELLDDAKRFIADVEDYLIDKF